MAGDLDFAMRRRTKALLITLTVGAMACGSANPVERSGTPYLLREAALAGHADEVAFLERQLGPQDVDEILAMIAEDDAKAAGSPAPNLGDLAASPRTGIEALERFRRSSKWEEPLLRAVGRFGSVRAASGLARHLASPSPGAFASWNTAAQALVDVAARVSVSREDLTPLLDSKDADAVQLGRIFQKHPLK